ncbi:hypothetical protein HaLaN_21705, partial [Haematococcus lacustris]
MEPLSDISRQLEQALRGYADKSGPSQLMQRVKPTIEREVNIAAKRLCAKWEAIVSGSQYQGTAVERSDLDILIQNRGSGMHATRQNRCLLAEDCKQGLEKALKDEDVEVSQQAYDMANKLTLAWPDGQRLTADLVFETTTHGRAHKMQREGGEEPINGIQVFFVMLKTLKAASSDTKHLDGL